MPATIKDVARESGVNVSTVSRALNGGYGVHSETRQLVRDVAERLRYRPNRVARGLVTGRAHTLGLVVSDIRNLFFAEVARGAEDAAYRAGYDLVLCNSDLDPEKQMRYAQLLTDKRVDGILMNSVAALSRKQQEQLAGLGVPITIVGTIGYVLAGLPQQSLMPPLSLGFVSLIGFALMAPVSSFTAPYGARLAHALSKRRLEVAFGCFLLAACVRFAVSLAGYG